MSAKRKPEEENKPVENTLSGAYSTRDDFDKTAPLPSLPTPNAVESKPTENKTIEVEGGAKRYKSGALDRRLGLQSYASAIVYCKRQEKCRCEFDAIFYHVACPDGVTALWAVLYNQLLKFCGLMSWKDLTTPSAEKEENGCKGHELCPVGAGKHPIVDSKAFYYNRRVLLVDVSFKRSYLEAVSRYQGESGSILILDHHKSAMRDLTESGLPPSIVVEFDMERAGCQIAWDRFCPDRSLLRPKLLEYVADRDLWKWKLPSSREVSYYMYQKFFLHGLSKMDKLNDLFATTKSEDILALAKEITPAYQVWRSQIERSVSGASTRRLRVPKINKYYKVKLFQSDISVVSEVGNELAMAGDCDFAVGWYYELDANSFGFSCRSDVNRTDIDLSEICAAFGGGGHAQAAGFKIPNVSIPVRVPQGQGLHSTVCAVVSDDKVALADSCPVNALFPDWERCERADKVREALFAGSSFYARTVISLPTTDSYLVSVPRDPSLQKLSLSPAGDDSKQNPESPVFPFADGWATRLKETVNSFPDFGLHHTLDRFHLDNETESTGQPMTK